MTKLNLNCPIAAYVVALDNTVSEAERKAALRAIRGVPGVLGLVSAGPRIDEAINLEFRESIRGSAES